MQSVYGVLKEAEHRSTFYIPYWNLPLASLLGGYCAAPCILRCAVFSGRTGCTAPSAPI